MNCLGAPEACGPWTQARAGPLDKTALNSTAYIFRTKHICT